MSADFNTAMALYRSGKHPEAATLCRSILQAAPRHSEAAHLLSLLLLEAGQLADAEYYAKVAVLGDKQNPVYHHALGKVYLAQGNRAEAARAFDRALHMSPGNLAAFSDRVRLAMEDQDFAAAERILTPMLERYPDLPDLLVLMAQVKKELKQYPELVRLGDHLLQLKPDYDDAQFLIRYALGLEEVGRLVESIQVHERVFAMLEEVPDVTPQNELAKAEIHYNIGLAYDNLGNFDQAKTHYERALVYNPEHSKCRFAYETLLIKTSDLQRDLSSFSMRFLLKDRQTRSYPWPEWKGEPLEGKRLLVWGEQGIGDVAMFAGFLPHVLPKVKTLMIDMFSYLVPVFERSFPGVKVAVFGDDFTPSSESLKEEFDYHAPMGSLMMYLLKEYQPRVVKGFFKPNPPRLQELRKRYDALGPGLKVGISWRTIHPHTRFKRDIPLEQWAPILKTPGCRFISLQYSGEEQELMSVREKLGVDIFLDKDVHPFENRDDFLTQIAAMDLVISIQNSAVHMGGATGTDTWLMLSRAADFRWGVTPNDSVFYPTVTIHRQPEYGDWSPVIDQIAAKLKIRAAQ